MLSLELTQVMFNEINYSLFQKHYVKFRTNGEGKYQLKESVFQKHYVKFRTERRRVL